MAESIASSAAAVAPGHRRLDGPEAGRVVRVNVSRGGVPKEAVPEAFVGRLGLEGDRHRAKTVHGGPHRAVCLLSIEAIRRIAAEGHPIHPGSVGENVTTEGIELAELPPGTRLAIGRDVLLEVSWPAMPCDTIVDSFRDRKSGRISILRHPRDSRMYARVLREGVVRPDDEIRVRPPDPASSAETHILLNRLESTERYSDVARWRAARSAGYPMAIIDDGELHAGASTRLPGMRFNTAGGLRTLPEELDRVLQFFRQTGSPGWVPCEASPWPGAKPVSRLVVLGGQSTAADGEPAVTDHAVSVRPIRPNEAEVWAGLHAAAFGDSSILREAWGRLLPGLLGPGHHALLAELEGRPVGVGLLATRGRVALLRYAGVIPDARGFGVGRSLVRARMDLARDLGADTVFALARDDNLASLRALEGAGLRPIWTRDVYRFEP